jgi:hypothetical protein
VPRQTWNAAWNELLCSERHLIYFECDPERHVCRTAISHNATIIAQSLVMRPQSILHLSLSACASHRNYTPRRTRTHTIIKITCMCIWKCREKDNNERDATEPEMPAVVVVLSIISVNAPLLYTHMKLKELQSSFFEINAVYCTWRRTCNKCMFVISKQIM